MKRVQAACMMQTLHFSLKDDGYPVTREQAMKAVQSENEQYRRQMDQRRVRYQIVEELPQEDGSLIVKVKKQVQGYPTTGYWS